MKKEKPKKNEIPEEISELEETIKESEEDENKDIETETQKEFEINPDFVEDLNLINIPLQTEPIFQRVQDEETLEQNIQFSPRIKTQKEKYDDSKYDINLYLENKYDKKTPNYTGTPETEKKENSDEKKN